MARTSDTDAEAASREATGWFLLLTEEPDDPATRRRFEAWRAASQAHATAWEETARVYGMIGEGQPAHAAHWRPLLAERQVRAPRRRRHRLSALAAVATLLVAMAPDIAMRLQADYVTATATAETRAIDLPDGSTVQLAPGSAISIAFDGGARDVRLLAGEAFFDVVPNPARPFHVVAEGVRTTVLGTAFDVRLADDGAAVMVSHGRVRVEYGNQARTVSETLKAGDWVRVPLGKDATRGTMPPEQVAEWRGGLIVARDRRVTDIVEELRRSYGGLILVTGDALVGKRVTGVYNPADPVAALTALAEAHGARVRRLSPWLLILSPS